MKTQIPGIIISVTAAADLTARRFVGLDGNVCGAGAKALGVCDVDTASGNQGPVVLNGVILIEAGAAVTAGSQVESDANSRAIPLNTGASNGYALDSASAAGELIRIVRGI